MGEEQSWPTTVRARLSRCARTVGDVVALLVYYRQVRDEPAEAEYWFGPAHEEMSRTLIIDKVRRAARTDGAEDGLFRAAAGHILLRERRENLWPTHGMKAS